MPLILFVLIFLLSACSHKNTVSEHSPLPKKEQSRYKQAQDGAPLGAIPTRFQTVKPRAEPFSRYGNPDTYSVNGRTYQVMRTASGYKARGIASWYGTKFHSMRTSSGDDYDMYAMTAAHRTLPLPSYVRVKNLENGKQAIVKINDRGPFHEDRVIDLSYAAAAKIGLLPKGTAKVEIEALTVREPGVSHVAHYYIQAGAFNSRQLASGLRQKLARLTPSPVFVETYQKRYVVKVGPFANKRMSDALKSKLAQAGIHGAFSLMQ